MLKQLVWDEDVDVQYFTSEALSIIMLLVCVCVCMCVCVHMRAYVWVCVRAYVSVRMSVRECV